jgi:hypothetical protein
MPALKRAFAFGAATLALVSLTHCGKVTDTSPASGTFGSVYQSMQNQNCVRCHAPSVSSSLAGGSSFDASTQAKAYATLVSQAVSATDVVSSCGSVMLVKPSSPATSYLLATLVPDTYWSADFGQTGCSPYKNGQHDVVSLSSDETTSYVSWIQNGALDN